jgi:hypothetical protein
MKINSIRLFLALLSSSLALSALVGCTSSSPGGTRNDFCGSRYQNPLVLDPKNVVSSTELVSGTAFAPPKGDYGYQGGSIFINDKYNDVRIELIENFDKFGNPGVYTQCAGGRGLMPNMNPLHFEVPFISDILSDGKIVQTRTRLLTVDIGAPKDMDHDFYIRPKVTYPEFPNVPIYRPGDPTITYDKYADHKQFFMNISIPNNPLNFALASYLNRPADNEIDGKNGVNVRVLIYYKTLSPDERTAVDKRKKH